MDLNRQCVCLLAVQWLSQVQQPAQALDFKVQALGFPRFLPH